MPVATRGALKLLDASDLDWLRPEVLLANTYHLMLRPGAQLIEEMGGIHRFSGWEGPYLSDSGGYQVFSLSPQVDAEGASFKSVYDGSLLRLTPASAVEAQERIGADIAMCLDVCSALPAERGSLEADMERTLVWAGRCQAAHRRGDQALFGVVQGGTDLGLRARCAKQLVEMGFDGYGIGGLSVGESRPEMLSALAATLEVLPEDQPRYLMGVGDPLSLVEAISMGVDMFDCVLPTRLARHGVALSWEGRLRLRAARFARQAEPIEADCSCVVCARYSRAYLRHLLCVGEPTGGRLLSLHNLWWTGALVRSARAAIVEGSLAGLVGRVRRAWGSAEA